MNEFNDSELCKHTWIIIISNLLYTFQVDESLTYEPYITWGNLNYLNNHLMTDFESPSEFGRIVSSFLSWYYVLFKLSFEQICKHASDILTAFLILWCVRKKTVY